jgi:hypothetical protein
MTDSELLAELLKDINNKAVSIELGKRPLRESFNFQYLCLKFETEDNTPPEQMTDNELFDQPRPFSLRLRKAYYTRLFWPGRLERLPYDPSIF